MVKPVGVEYNDVITIKGKQDKTKPKTPFVLRGPNSTISDNESSQTCTNIVMHSCTKLVLRGPTPSDPELEQHKDKPLTGPSRKGIKLATTYVPASYNIIDQLQ